MQPLGSQELTDAYHLRITGDHDFSVEARVLSMEEKLVGPAVLLGGQVNIQRDSLVRRTATFQFLDPDYALNLDSASPFEGALFADRMVQIRHTVSVPGHGDVTVVPFVGPMVTLKRDGDVISVECQDKASLGIRGTRPYRVKKGMNAVAAIRAILRERTGETRFRFPSGTKRRLPKTFNVGWADEAAPWVVCQRIAQRVLGMQLIYSCDGYATLRERSRTPVFTFDATRNLTGLVAAGYDFSQAVNFARVEVGKVTVKTAALEPAHQLSKEALGRKLPDGRLIPRFLPLTSSMSAPTAPKKLKKDATSDARKKRRREVVKYDRKIRNISQQAQREAREVIQANRKLAGDFTWTAVPVYHLDVDDMVRIRTPQGGITLRLSEGSVGVLTEGDMTCGRRENLKTVTRRGKRGRR